MNIEGLSIKQLQALLSQLDNDIKAAAPPVVATIKRDNKVDNEGLLCNEIAKRYTGNKQVKPVQNAKLKAEIAIQHDIIDYLNNGGHIITERSRVTKRNPRNPGKELNPFTLSLYKKISI